MKEYKIIQLGSILKKNSVLEESLNQFGREG